MLAMVNPRTRVFGWLLAAAASVVEFGGFIASRTVGLPHGYRETWASQPEDLLGLVCLVTEIGVVVLAALTLRRGVTANNTAQSAPMPAVTSGALTGERDTGQETAAFTNAATFFSTAELHFLSAYDTGHPSPSSRLAASWKPRVE